MRDEIRRLVRLVIPIRCNRNETMVCNFAGSECTAQLDKDATLKQALEELLKCMLRVWCREGQALARFGATATGNEQRGQTRQCCLYRGSTARISQAEHNENENEYARENFDYKRTAPKSPSSASHRPVRDPLPN